MENFMDKYGCKVSVKKCKDGVEISITGKGSYEFVVLNNYKAQELGKGIINASGGLKLWKILTLTKEEIGNESN